MIIGSHSKDNLFQDAYLSNVPIAKERLKTFPLLNQIFDNFAGYEKLRYKQSRNKVFIVCSPRLTGSDEVGYPKGLEDLETALRAFNINSWQRADYKEYVNRLRSYDYYQSEGAMLELLAALEVGKKIGFENVSLHPKLKDGKKKGDLLVKLQDRQLFLELTSLTKKEVTRSIEYAFNRLAEYVNKKCLRDNYSIILYINTGRLKKDKEGRVDKEEYAIYLESWADKLFLHELEGFDGYVDFRHDYSWIGNKKHLLELIGTEYEFSVPAELVEAIKNNPIVAEWSSKIDIQLLNQSPIAGVVFASDSRGDFIEVQSEEFYPSPAAIAQESAFHAHIENKVRDKIRVHQYDEGNPAIIMIKEDIWNRMFFHDDPESEKKIEQIISKVLEETVWISGVVIYDALSNGKYIRNHKANPKIVITPDELLSIGIID